jgi:hypothetical protein
MAGGNDVGGIVVALNAVTVEVCKIVQIRCWDRMNRALQSGELIKPDPCDRCGKNAKRIEGHHNIYCRPLEVEWLCLRCHRAEHKRLRKEATALVNLGDPDQRHMTKEERLEAVHV